jgi:hypothetical protein
MPNQPGSGPGATAASPSASRPATSPKIQRERCARPECQISAPAKTPAKKSGIGSRLYPAAANPPLSGVQAGLGGIAAHERSVDLVVEEGVGVDITGDEGEDSGERALRQGIGGSRYARGLRRAAHFFSGMVVSPLGKLAKTVSGTRKLVASNRSGLAAIQAVMEID